MLTKIFSRVLPAAIIAVLASAMAFAQSAPVTGTVMLKKADGSQAPLEGATVEVFRTDAKASGPADKTDKKGRFTFAGLQIGAVYVLSVSGPGASPSYLPNIRAGSTDLSIVLNEGDGKKLTADEVRSALAQGSAAGGQTTGEMTEEEKKAKAELDKKIAEINAKNEKIKAETAIIEASLKDGNAAYQTKDYDTAIAKYDEGINANPTFAGSAPVLMNNKGAALRERAVANYNKHVKDTDPSAKVEAFKGVKADLGAAADSHSKAYEILKNAGPEDIKDPQAKTNQMNVALRGAFDTFRLMSLTEQVDDTKIDIAKAMIPEYIAVETDAAKKDQAKLILGDLYRVVGDADNAIIEYRKVIEASPDNLDALAGLGLSLVNAGYINNNKEQLQEGANYLQKYASAAPDGHKYKNDALGLIESLKAEQKIAPQKVPSGGKRKN